MTFLVFIRICCPYFAEMALLLPAALSHNRHANDSSDIRRNLRMRYHDSYKHNRDHEWVYLRGLYFIQYLYCFKDYFY